MCWELVACKDKQDRFHPETPAPKMLGFFHLRPRESAKVGWVGALEKRRKGLTKHRGVAKSGLRH